MLRLACIFLLALIAAAPADAPGATPLGVWQDADARVRVEIAPCEDRLCGTIVWFRRPNDAVGLPLTDIRNKDPALRAQPVMGLKILHGLRPTGPRTWGDGRLYNPDDGQTYQVSLTLQDDGRLRLRAFVLLPLFGKTRWFSRAE